MSAGLGRCMCSLVFASRTSRMGTQCQSPHECSCRCYKAAEAGDLQFLQMRPHKLEEYQHTGFSFYAAQGGQLEVLQ